MRPILLALALAALLTTFTHIWAENGFILDPNGLAADNGLEIDPDGLQQTNAPTASAACDNGFIIDPNGRCTA